MNEENVQPEVNETPVSAEHAATNHPEQPTPDTSFFEEAINSEPQATEEVMGALLEIVKNRRNKRAKTLTPMYIQRPKNRKANRVAHQSRMAQIKNGNYRKGN